MYEVVQRRVDGEEGLEAVKERKSKKATLGKGSGREEQEGGQKDRRTVSLSFPHYRHAENNSIFVHVDRNKGIRTPNWTPKASQDK